MTACTVALFWWCIGRHPNLAFRDDFQSYFMPMLLEIGRSWLRGQVPLLSAHSWFGGALAAEYAPGALSPATGLVAVITELMHLSLAQAAAFMVDVFLAVLAAGTFRLLRVRGARCEWAAAMTLVVCLNGFVVAWAATNWFSLLMALPWLVWFWWAAEREFRSWRARVLTMAVFAYLVIVAGAPWVLLMTLLVTAFLIVRAPGARARARETMALGVSWLIALGLGLAAPLMLREYFASTLRAVWHGGGAGWTPPLNSLVGLVLPTYRTGWQTFEFPLSHSSVEMIGAFVPVVLIVASLIHGARELVKRAKWELALLGLVTVLLLSPGFGPFRWSFRWLLFWHLAAAVVAAESLGVLEGMPAAQPARLPSWVRQPAAVGLAMLLPAWWVTLRSDADPLATRAVALAMLTLLGAWFALRLAWRSAGRWFPAVTVVTSLLVAYAVIPITESVPTWDSQRWQAPEPILSHDREYLAIYTHADVVRGWRTPLPLGIGESLWPANTPMVHGYDFVNGYSPMEPAGLGLLLSLRMQGFMVEENARALLAHETGPTDVLAQLGIEGLLLAPRFADFAGQLERDGWRRRESAENLVFERPESLPPVFAAPSAIMAGGVRELLLALRSRPAGVPGLALLAPLPEGKWTLRNFAPAEVTELARSPIASSVRVSVLADGPPALIVFRRPWYPGFRATLGGQELPVLRANLVMPAVVLSPGASGTLRLRYRPRALEIGRWSAVLTLLSVMAWLLVSGRRRLGEQGESR